MKKTDIEAQQIQHAIDQACKGLTIDQCQEAINQCLAKIQHAWKVIGNAGIVSIPKRKIGE